MPKTHPPPPNPGAKTGAREGDTPNTDASRRSPRPVDEEDVFGGAERTHNEDVASEKAKP